MKPTLWQTKNRGKLTIIQVRFLAIASYRKRVWLPCLRCLYSGLRLSNRFRMLAQSLSTFHAPAFSLRYSSAFQARRFLPLGLPPSETTILKAF